MAVVSLVVGFLILLNPSWSAWVRSYVGDAIAVICLYFLYGFLHPVMTPVPKLFAALGIAVAFEIAQAFLPGTRNWLMQAVTGGTFNPNDFVAYGVGAALAVAVDLQLIFRCRVMSGLK